MSQFEHRLQQSDNGSGCHPTFNLEPLTTVVFQTKAAAADDRPTRVMHRPNRMQISLPELALMAGMAGVIVVGWVALTLAQLGRLTPTSVVVVLGAAASIIVVLALTRPMRIPHSAARITHYAIRITRHTVRALTWTWHDVALAALLLITAILYTPPADYAPAILDAGWYTNTGALIARTGRLTIRPPELENLSPADRRLFIRTYRDHNASMPRFPDRRDLGFYNLTFAVDLGRDGAVVPYHPPFTSVWIAILRLIGGPALGAYAAPLFGLLFVLAVYAAGRALLGPNVGLVAALLTALSPPTVYYARTPFAELLCGALIWAGVYALARYGTVSGRRPNAPSPHFPGSLTPRPPGTSRTVSQHTALSSTLRDRATVSPYPRSSSPLLLFAGLAFGTALLVKIESFLLLPPIALFWLIWLRRRWATRREFAVFLMPFGTLLSHAALLYLTLLRPYTVLNGYGIWAMLVRAFSRPETWIFLTALYVASMGILVAVQRRWLTPLAQFWERAQPAAGLMVLASAGLVLLFVWPASQANTPSTWSSLATLGLFLTPLGLCLGIIGLSTLVADDLNRRTMFLVLLISTAGLATLLMPAISSDVSSLYTIRRQLPVVVPTLLLLTSYVTLRWAGLADGDRQSSQQLPRWRRVLVILILVLLLMNFLDTLRPLIKHQELAGSSVFTAELAQSFGPDDIVLFESADRGAHVGRFAAPLWAEHGVSAMVLSSTYPPQDRLADTIQHWQGQGRQVYFVSQSQPPPLILPNFAWTLIDTEYWAGSTIAARLSFPPETWTIQVPFYIYEPEALSRRVLEAPPACASAEQAERKACQARSP